MATKAKASKVGKNGTPPNPEGVLTLAEAAKLLRVSEEGLKLDAIAGRVPCRLIAGEWRFTKAALFEWLSVPPQIEHSTGTGSPRPWTPEVEREAEAEIAQLRAARKSLGTVGEMQAKAAKAAVK